MRLPEVGTIAAWIERSDGERIAPFAVSDADPERGVVLCSDAPIPLDPGDYVIRFVGGWVEALPLPNGMTVHQIAAGRPEFFREFSP